MQLQPDGCVQTLNLLDPGLMPYTQINGSTFPGADPAVVSATPPASDPNYATKIIAFAQTSGAEYVRGSAGQLLQRPSRPRSRCAGRVPQPAVSGELLPGFNLQIWGAPTSKPADDPTNNNFIYQRFQRSIMHYDARLSLHAGPAAGRLLQVDHHRSEPAARPGRRSAHSNYYKQYDPSQATVRSPDPATAQQRPDQRLHAAARRGGGGNAHRHRRAQTQLGLRLPGPHVGLQPGRQDQTVGLIQQAGFNWMKHQVEWSNIETAPGQYDWTRARPDRQHRQRGRPEDHAQRASHAPTFYRSPTSGLTPADPNTYQTLHAGDGQPLRGQGPGVRALERGEPVARDGLPATSTRRTTCRCSRPATRASRRAISNALALLGAPSPTGANIPGESIDDLTYLQQLYAINGGEVEELLRRAVGAPERLLESAGLHAGHAAVQPVRRLQQRPQLLRLLPREPVPRPDGRSKATATRRSGSPSSATARTRRRRRATSTARRSTPRRRRTSWCRRSRWRARWTTSRA